MKYHVVACLNAKFSDNFMFQLTQEEFDNLKSQFVISSWGGPRRALPYAFTEQGVTISPPARELSVAGHAEGNRAVGVGITLA
ncbi:MAG: ORF6N domain-containing protein [Pseudomonadota bacterium]